TLNYLKGEKVLKDAITLKDKVYVNYSANNPGAYIDPKRSNDGTNQVNYDPNVGTATVNDDQLDKSQIDQEQGSIQSPALGFLHELDHFLGWIQDGGTTSDLLNATPEGKYDNLEEARVITGSEADAANRLGEPIRTNHGGVPVIVNGPTSRTKFDNVPSIKLQLKVRQEIQNSSKNPAKNPND
ncbi:MAG TPA: hypothetical protein PLA68_09245, partial [Panacibacter sp.]|nr:hypothetical protein [Panacibacter sp.]